MKMKNHMSMFCPDACKNHANFVGTVLANAKSVPGIMKMFCPGLGKSLTQRIKKTRCKMQRAREGRRPLWLAQLVCKTAAKEIAH
tara:strand:- start:276 stop:530 length:255 start_codon:yes stop_codon:yes gene_type:complete